MARMEERKFEREDGFVKLATESLINNPVVAERLNVSDIALIARKFSELVFNEMEPERREAFRVRTELKNSEESFRNEQFRNEQGIYRGRRIGPRSPHFSGF